MIDFTVTGEQELPGVVVIGIEPTGVAVEAPVPLEDAHMVAVPNTGSRGCCILEGGLVEVHSSNELVVPHVGTHAPVLGVAELRRDRPTILVDPLE